MMVRCVVGVLSWVRGSEIVVVSCCLSKVFLRRVISLRGTQKRWTLVPNDGGLRTRSDDGRFSDSLSPRQELSLQHAATFSTVQRTSTKIPFAAAIQNDDHARLPFITC